jgi:Heterokaryon incompatibility protein (HET)
VTATVDSILRHLRKVHKHRLVWLDPVCLNQDNTKEKTMQVPKPNEFYWRAKKVHIWLGEADTEIQKFPN